MNTTDSTVIVIDGQTRWACRRADLISALDALGWERGITLGQRSRTEPPGAPGEAYASLCGAVPPIDMPGDDSLELVPAFVWYPAEEAWIWEPR